MVLTPNVSFLQLLATVKKLLSVCSDFALYMQVGGDNLPCAR